MTTNDRNLAIAADVLQLHGDGFTLENAFYALTEKWHLSEDTIKFIYRSVKTTRSKLPRNYSKPPRQRQRPQRMAFG